MKNVVECQKEFFAYFNALETYGVGLSQSVFSNKMRLVGYGVLTRFSRADLVHRGLVGALDEKGCKRGLIIVISCYSSSCP